MIAQRIFLIIGGVHVLLASVGALERIQVLPTSWAEPHFMYALGITFLSVIGWAWARTPNR